MPTSLKNACPLHYPDTPRRAVRLDHRFDPFRNWTVETSLPILGSYIAFGLVLIPLRIFCIISIFVLAYLCTLPIRLFPSLDPLYVPYILTPLCRASLMALGFRLRVHGKSALGQGGAYVGKAGIKSAPLVGAIATAAKTIFVQRAADSSSKRGSSPAASEGGAISTKDGSSPAPPSGGKGGISSTAATRMAIASTAADLSLPRVVLFPEGTTTNGGAIIHFKMGAFSPLLPVQPVVIRYPFRRVDPSYTMSLTRLLWRVLTSLYHTVELTWLPPITPKDGENAVDFAERVRAAMASALGVGLSDHTLEDLRLQDQAVSVMRPLLAGRVTTALYCIFGGALPRGVILETSLRQSFNVQSLRLKKKFGVSYDDLVGFARTYARTCVALKTAAPRLKELAEVLDPSYDRMAIVTWLDGDNDGEVAFYDVASMLSAAVASLPAVTSLPAMSISDLWLMLLKKPTEGERSGIRHLMAATMDRVSRGSPMVGRM